MKNATACAGSGWLIAALLLAALSAGAETPGEPTPPAPAEASYRLQPGDVVEVSVWKETDLNRQALVRSDGGLTFPLVGDLIVAGLTTAEVRHEIEERLGKFIPAAAVTVAVQQINGNQLYVVGRVSRPGAYKFDRPLDVMQVLSLAGGTTEFAKVDDIRILRRAPDGRQQTFKFAYSEVVAGRRLEQNVVLQSGDTLVVP
jgi:polysaccharide export outer membrane protein